MPGAAHLEAAQLELEPESDPRAMSRQRHVDRARAAGIRPPTGRSVRRPAPATQRPRLVAFIGRLLESVFQKDWR